VLLRTSLFRQDHQNRLIVGYGTTGPELDVLNISYIPENEEPPRTQNIFRLQSE